MNANLKTIVIWFVVIAAVVIGYQIFNTASAQRQPSIPRWICETRGGDTPANVATSSSGRLAARRNR